MSKKLLLIFPLILIAAILFYTFSKNGKSLPSFQTDTQDNMGGEAPSEPYSLSIEALRQGDYPGSDIVIEKELDSGSNYQKFIASYKSEGLKIYGLLTLPKENPPVGGYPAIIFNHGFIPPTEYRTDERYVAYQDGFARNGYITFKSDYRGHGNSEGNPSGAYGSNGYTIDVLNGLSSIKKLKYPSTNTGRMVNPNKIGMWGHSSGGFITLRVMVVRLDIKAGVIWAGVVGSYQDLFERWRRRAPSGALSASGTPSTRGRSWRQTLTAQFGTPAENPEFWKSLSANSYLKDISGPIQLHHGTEDSSVPIEFSRTLEKQLKEAGKTVELYEYPGDDHNIAANFNIASQRSVEFFNKYLK